MRGLLVCVCGPDASGKTTLIDKFLEKNSDWEVFKFPNRNTVIGQKIDLILKGELKVSKEVELKLFADNRAEFRKHILEKITSGKNVILDRYVYCGMAYTMTQQFEDTMDGKCKLLNDDLTIRKIALLDKDNYKPDLVVLTTADYSSKRIDKEKYDFLDRNVLLNNYIQSFLYTKTPFCLSRASKNSLKFQISKFCDPNKKLVKFL